MTSFAHLLHGAPHISFLSPELHCNVHGSVGREEDKDSSWDDPEVVDQTVPQRTEVGFWAPVLERGLQRFPVWSPCHYLSVWYFSGYWLLYSRLVLFFNHVMLFSEHVFRSELKWVNCGIRIKKASTSLGQSSSAPISCLLLQGGDTK